jgi:hypothetical protein
MSFLNEQLKKIDDLITTDIIYANHASAAFNLRLYTTIKQITAEVHQALGDNLIALILSGGYGRGEGGVIRKFGKECPFSSLDFTLIVNCKSAVKIAALDQIRMKFGEELNIQIEFSRPFTVNDVRHFPNRLIWQDLLKGHVVTFGSRDILTTNVPESIREPLPVIEATRLLLNQGAELLQAMRILKGVEQGPHGDFVRRNYYQCALSLGDALLITHQRYKTQYTGRDENLARLASENQDIAAINLMPLYTEALRFKFSPDDVPYRHLGEAQLQALAEAWSRVFLYVEGERTGRQFISLDDYVDWNGLREFEQHQIKLLPRNLIRNLQTKKLSLRSPREELFRALPTLLEIGNKPMTHWNEKSEQFLALWRQFN